MVFIMAGVPNLRFTSLGEAQDSVAVDSVPQDTIDPVVPIDTIDAVDSLDSIALKDSVLADTVGMDSLQLLIWKRNKAID